MDLETGQIGSGDLKKIPYKVSKISITDTFGDPYRFYTGQNIWNW